MERLLRRLSCLQAESLRTAQPDSSEIEDGGCYSQNLQEEKPQRRSRGSRLVAVLRQGLVLLWSRLAVWLEEGALALRAMRFRP